MDVIAVFIGYGQKIIGSMLGSMQIMLGPNDRGSPTHFYTPDSDDNRNIFEFISPRRNSYTVYTSRVLLWTNYPATLHKIDVFYCDPDTKDWKITQDSPDYVHSAGLGKYLKDVFKDSKWSPVEISARQTKQIDFLKLSVSSTSNPHGNREYNQFFYQDVLFVLHLNTSFVCINLLIPEWTNLSDYQAYIIGKPHIYRRYDPKQFFLQADEIRKGIEIYGTDSRRSTWLRTS